MTTSTSFSTLKREAIAQVGTQEIMATTSRAELQKTLMEKFVSKYKRKDASPRERRKYESFRRTMGKWLANEVIAETGEKHYDKRVKRGRNIRTGRFEKWGETARKASKLIFKEKRKYRKDKAGRYRDAQGRYAKKKAVERYFERKKKKRAGPAK